MAALEPEQLRKIQTDLVDLSQRLHGLAQDFQSLAASLPLEVDAVVSAPSARVAEAPTVAQQAAPPAPVAPPPPPAPAWAPPARTRAATQVVFTGAAATPRVAARPVPPKQPRRQVSIAEVFSIVGSAITLLGVSFVLLLPANEVLSDVQRSMIGLGLALIAVVVALVQHHKEPANIGSQALMATGVASAFLTVLALSALFHQASGEPLLPPVAGIAVAGLISLGGVGVARWWRSQWLAMLAVLGSLILAPYLGGEHTQWPMAFMLLMTLVTAAFQHRLEWAGLLLARVLPTAIYFCWVFLVRGNGSVVELMLAFLLAAGGLGIGVLHQHGSPRMRAIGVAGMVALVTPMMLAIWAPDRWLSVALAGVLGLLLAAVGFLPKIFADHVRAAAVPLGAVFILLAVVRFTDGHNLGYVFFSLAAVYFALAARTTFRPVLVVAWAAAALGVVTWLPVLSRGFSAIPGDALEMTAESVLGLIATILAVRAVRAFRDDWGNGLIYLSWSVAVVFGSMAMITGGILIGARINRLDSGFQTAHALVTVAWLLVSVLLLRRGLRREADSSAAVRLAIALAAAAVLKLFFFDLSTLPDLVRALAFLAVGVLMLVIGTWYHKQLERGRPGTSAAVPASPPITDPGSESVESADEVDPPPS